jgi:hypothetical protein
VYANEGERENSRDAYHPSGGEEYVQTVGRKHEGKKPAIAETRTIHREGKNMYKPLVENMKGRNQQEIRTRRSR